MAVLEKQWISSLVMEEKAKTKSAMDEKHFYWFFNDIKTLMKGDHKIFSHLYIVVLFKLKHTQCLQIYCLLCILQIIFNDFLSPFLYFFFQPLSLSFNSKNLNNNNSKLH